MPEPQHRQGDHRDPEHQSGAGFRVGLGAHQNHREGGDQQREDDDGTADHVPQPGVDPRPHRPGGVKPGRRGDHHCYRHQTQSQAVAAVARLDVTGAAD